MKISFVSNLKLSESSGGWSGINLNMFLQLKKQFEIEYIGPIDPSTNLEEKVISKILRTLGLKGAFFFFSEKRLSQIRNIFQSNSVSNTDAYFFFGNTPWVKIRPTKPYYVYMDADFITYLKVFSKYSKFSNKSIQRIKDQEKNWLENAEKIFFGSNWIKNETINNLNLSECDDKYVIVNTGGHIPIPDNDNYKYNSSELKLLFIALNFEKKGGYDAVEILEKTRKYIPNTVLTIIGEEPPKDILNIDGIRYKGKLNKNNQEDLKIMESAFQSASFLIHPTKMDTMGAIIPEANYYGTPAVAANRFGVPDLIEVNHTGFLINEKDSAEQICLKIINLFLDEEKYLSIRKYTRDRSIREFSWDAIGKKIYDSISRNS